MPDEKVIAQLRNDFLTSLFTELRTLASPAVEYSQAALQDENDPALKEPLTIIHKTNQNLLDGIVYCLGLEPDRWTDEFAFTPCYELWSNATVIAAYADWLLQKPPSPLDEAQRRTLIRIRESGVAIFPFMARLTEVLRIEKRRTDISMGHLAKADLAEADLKETIEEFVSSPRKQGLVEVEAQGLDALPEVWVDSSHEVYEVSRALDFIAAALSVNFSQGKIVLTANCDGDMITIRLENAGFALPTSTLEELKRASSAATLFACRRFDEALGLCISQAIVEIHGGKLWTESRSGGGSLVALTLPVMKH